LIEFFTSDHTKRKYALAGYVPFDGVWSRVEQLYKKLHAQIAHSDPRRTADAAKKIGHEDRVEIYNLLRQELERFKTTYFRTEYRHIDLGVLPPLRITAPETLDTTNKIFVVSTHTSNSQLHISGPITPSDRPGLGPTGPSKPPSGPGPRKS
jgi:hypothetical protein